MSSLLPAVRSRLSTAAPSFARHARRSFASTTSSFKQGPGTGENFVTNDAANTKDKQTVSQTNEKAIDAYGAQDKPLQENVEDAEKKRQLQAPNRASVWSRSQMPRELAMTGPRFEQTIIEAQPRPYAAIELIRKQPVRWVDTKAVACDGGGGPLGHPKIFINVDKPQICVCTYCGLPYAHTHHKKLLQSLPADQLAYPLEPTNDPAQVRMPDTPSQKGEIQGQYPILKGEVNAEGQNSQAFSQR